MSAETEAPTVEVLYTNYRGETRWRTIRPGKLWWGKTAWHPERQWLMVAYDVEKAAFRDFAMSGIHKWGRSSALPCGFCGDVPATWVCRNCGNVSAPTGE